MKPKIAILRTDGVNCDEELYHAFQIAGGEPEMVHVNQLIKKGKKLDDFQILALPGGFSYGDDILSAKILANDLRYRLGEEIDKFVAKKKLIIGICNGFQVLVRMGLLPWKMKPAEDVSLIFNDTGRFECRWVKLRIEASNCIFTQNLDGQTFEMPVAHGEGKFVVKSKPIAKKLKDDNHIVARYIDKNGEKANEYPHNPNGSCDSIAGITDSTGCIFGLMPHPERNIFPHHHPNWRRNRIYRNYIPTCVSIFRNTIGCYK